jgi:hypothetical protein
MLQKINRQHALGRAYNADLEARIQAFELAFRMQTEAPEVLSIDKESEATKKLYGIDRPETRDFGWQCLLTRRLAERGVRFIQCTHSTGASMWDQHTELVRGHTRNAQQVDCPLRACSRILKLRLTEGYFGSVGCQWCTPVAQGDGRDHNPYGFSCGWRAEA